MPYIAQRASFRGDDVRGQSDQAEDRTPVVDQHDEDEEGRYMDLVEPILQVSPGFSRTGPKATIVLSSQGRGFNTSMSFGDKSRDHI